MAQAQVETEADIYLTAFKGRFTSLMRWDQLDVFWQTLNSQVDDNWYIYHIGDPAPDQAVTAEQLKKFIAEIDVLLRSEHDEDYCAIVYADDHDTPAFIKIFDPNNLGVSCGFSENPPLPGWVLSKIRPVDIEDALRPANNRSRWWQKIFE
ncbi:MAG: hypothetical protein OEZ38_06055 [Gammaproteobacteria bacterium]|nr:hypothetical protein [Gammaproteobacteria bacterium]